MANIRIPEKHKENILIFLDSNSYNPSTIQRGAMLAKAFGCPFHVWYGVDATEKEKDEEHSNRFLSESKKMSLYFGAKSFIVSPYYFEKDFRAALEVIEQELDITCLVLAGSVESRWEEFLFGSSIHYLMKKFPHIEVYFISSNLIFPYESWDYEKGKKAVLVEDKNGYFISYRDLKGIKGIFFRKKAAEFESGVFVFTQDNEIKSYRIHGGNVTGAQNEFYKRLTILRIL